MTKQKEAFKENETEMMKVKRENIAVKSKLSVMETYIKTFKDEREKMKEWLLDIKCRWMKCNLVSYWFEGNTVWEYKRKTTRFLGTRTRIRTLNRIRKCFWQRKPENEIMRKKSYQTLRPIVFRFIYHRDLAYVLENAKTINQQFPL